MGHLIFSGLRGRISAAYPLNAPVGRLSTGAHDIAMIALISMMQHRGLLDYHDGSPLVLSVTPFCWQPLSGIAPPATNFLVEQHACFLKLLQENGSVISAIR